MTEGGSAPARGARPAASGRRTLVVCAWVAWTAVLLSAAVLVWRGWEALPAAGGGVRLMLGLALALFVPYLPLRLLSSWRLRRAARRLPEAWRSGGAPLPGWPGVREKDGRLTMKCGGGSFRLWALGLGLGLSAYLLGQMTGKAEALSAFDVGLSLAPALVALLASLLWGPSGWLLTIDAARSQCRLMRWRALRRTYLSTASLPTVQAVELPAHRRGEITGIIVRRATGPDWKLGVPGNWPAELVEALAARMANLAGVDFNSARESAGGPKSRAASEEAAK